MSRTFTHSSTGTVVEYPNATHFAFVPAIFKITKIPTTYDKLEMVLTDRQAQQSYSEEREPFNGAAYSMYGGICNCCSITLRRE